VPENLQLKIKALEEKIRLLEIENSDWTGRAEDIFLFASTAESISLLTDEKEVFETVLEKISIIKNIPYCAFGTLNNEKLIIDYEYSSFSNKETNVTISLSPLLKEKLLKEKIIIEDCNKADSQINVKFEKNKFIPEQLIIILFNNLQNQDGFLICITNTNNDNLDIMKSTLNHSVTLINSRLDNLYLMKQLSKQNENLEIKIAESLGELEEEIKQHIKTEDELKKSEKKFRNIFENHSAIKFLIDPETGNIVDANKAAAKFYMWTIEQLKSMNIRQINILSKEIVDRALLEAKNNKRKYFVFKHCKADGTICDVEVYGSPIEVGGKIFVHSIVQDITEKKKAEDELKKNEILFQLITENAFDFIWVIDMNMNITYASSSVLRLLGYTTDEITKINLSDLYKPEQLLFIQNLVEEELGKGVPHKGVTFNIKHLRKDKSEFMAEVKAKIIYNNNEPIIIQGYTRDISQQIEANNKLLKSEERFARLSSLTYEGIMIHKSGIVLDVNPAFERITGYSIDELTDKNIIELLIPIKYHKLVLGNLNNAVVVSYEIEVIRKDGKIIPIEVESRKIEFENDYKNIRVTAFRDISRKKEREYEILKLSKAITQSPVSVVITDIDGKIEYANRKFIELTGYSLNEAIGKTPRILSSGKHDKIFYKELWETILSGKEWTGEFHNKKKSGELFWESASISPIKDDNGKTTNFVAVKEDITEKKKTLESLKTSEERYRITTEATGDVYYHLMFEDMKYKYIHPNIEKLTGYRTDEINLKSIILEIQKNGNVLTAHNIKNARLTSMKPTYSADYLIKTKSGELKWISDRSYSVYNQNNVVIGSYGILSDITEKKKMIDEVIKAKEEAEKADKMKSIFLAQMSHEIRTPINALVSMSSLLRYDFEKIVTEDQKQSFNIIDRAGNRIIRTIDLLLNLSEIQAGTYEKENNKFDLYSEVLLVLVAENKKNAENKNIDLTLTNTELDTILFADYNTVNQIFVQLIDNAIKYTKVGKVAIKVYRNEEENLEVEIKDTGIGIDEKYLPNLFEPFSQEEMGYTRKYEGNGIGMALVKKYCELNNIKIEVESKKSVGTTFRVVF